MEKNPVAGISVPMLERAERFHSHAVKCVFSLITTRAGYGTLCGRTDPQRRSICALPPPAVRSLLFVPGSIVCSTTWRRCRRTMLRFAKLAADIHRFSHDSVGSAWEPSRSRPKAEFGWSPDMNDTVHVRPRSGSYEQFMFHGPSAPIS